MANSTIVQGIIYGDLKTYHSWKEVPSNLKTRTALKREGFYVPHGVKAVAQIITNGAFSRERKCFLLYNKRRCKPVTNG